MYSTGRYLPISDSLLIIPQIWPNFGPSGLNKYSYLTVKPGETQDVVNTPLRVTVYPVYHAYPYLSTAFLFSDDEQFLLYFGDMGPDEVENQKVVPPDEQHKIREVWKQVCLYYSRTDIPGGTACSRKEYVCHLYGIILS